MGYQLAGTSSHSAVPHRPQAVRTAACIQHVLRSTENTLTVRVSADLAQGTAVCQCNCCRWRGATALTAPTSLSGITNDVMRASNAS
jgi:hypothetical protein